MQQALSNSASERRPPSSRTARTRRAGCGTGSAPGGPPVVFVPFGVDVDAFRPVEAEPDTDVLSVGVDPRRDFELLARDRGAQPGAELPHRRGQPIVRAASESLPANVDARDGHPARAGARRDSRRRAASRCPCATTATPARPRRSCRRWPWASRSSCRAPPRSPRATSSRTASTAGSSSPATSKAFERALLETLTGADAARALGSRARQTVERSFSWERFTDALWEVLSRC